MYPVSVFIERFRAAVSVLIGLCCPAILKSYSRKCTYRCIIGHINDDDDDDDDDDDEVPLCFDGVFSCSNVTIA